MLSDTSIFYILFDSTYSLYSVDAELVGDYTYEILPTTSSTLEQEQDYLSDIFCEVPEGTESSDDAGINVHMDVEENIYEGLWMTYSGCV